MAVYMLILAKQGSALTKPDELLLAYMDCISERNYKEMAYCGKDGKKGCPASP